MELFMISAYGAHVGHIKSRPFYIVATQIFKMKSQRKEENRYLSSIQKKFTHKLLGTITKISHGRFYFCMKDRYYFCMSLHKFVPFCIIVHNNLYYVLVKRLVSRDVDLPLRIRIRIDRYTIWRNKPKFNIKSCLRAAYATS